MLDRGVLLRVWAARRQVALVGSGHRSCADSEARRATQADGGTGSEVSELGEGGGGRESCLEVGCLAAIL